MSEPTPIHFMEAAQGYQKSAVARTAIELDVFTAIGQGYHTAQALSAHCGTAERGMRVLCDALVVLHLLHKEGDIYLLTDESALFLDRRSERYLGDCVEFVQSSVLAGAFERLTEAVRRGGARESGQRLDEPAVALWRTFARVMAPLMHTAVQKMAEVVIPAGRVLDIAAGRGHYGIRLLECDASARVVAVDLPGVLELARENADKAGVGNRWQGLPGSAFEVEFGPDFDTALVTNFLHSYGREACIGLLRKIHASVRKGGRVFVLETVPEENRVKPSAPAWFAVTMLATTPDGDAHTLSEYDSMLREAGFTSPIVHAVPGAARHILAADRI